MTVLWFYVLPKNGSITYNFDISANDSSGNFDVIYENNSWNGIYACVGSDTKVSKLSKSGVSVSDISFNSNSFTWMINSFTDPYSNYNITKKTNDNCGVSFLKYDTATVGKLRYLSYTFQPNYVYIINYISNSTTAPNYGVQVFNKMIPTYNDGKLTKTEFTTFSIDSKTGEEIIKQFSTYDISNNIFSAYELNGYMIDGTRSGTSMSIPPPIGAYFLSYNISINLNNIDISTGNNVGGSDPYNGINSYRCNYILYYIGLSIMYDSLFNQSSSLNQINLASQLQSLYMLNIVGF